MIYIPDLFSAYTKGQESAIDRNWNDLNQYEGVEQARTANDMARINLQAGMDDYGNNRAISDALGSQAMIGEDLLKRMYRGDAANAEMNSDMALSQYGAVTNNLGSLDSYNNAILSDRLGSGTYNANMNIDRTGVQQGNAARDLGLFGDALDSKYLVDRQNVTAAPLANQQMIDNNSASQGLNALTIAQGVGQVEDANAMRPLVREVQQLSLQEQAASLRRLPIEQRKVEQQRVVETLNMLRQQTMQYAAQISYLQQQVQLNPGNPSATNSEILRYRDLIRKNTKTIAETEAAMGTSTENTVQSLMGN